MEVVEVACVFMILNEHTKAKLLVKEGKGGGGHVKSKKSVWVKPWLAIPRQTNAFGNISAEPWLWNLDEFRNYLRMNRVKRTM